MRIIIPLVFISLSMSYVFSSETPLEKDPEPFFEGYTWTLLIESMDGEEHYEYNPELADTPLPPCSTFKIPNSLIGLDSSVVNSLDHRFKFEGEPTWNEQWNRDHTLRTAFRHSTVWYFQRFARKVGEEKMQAYLDALDYGNRDISAGIDQFWLGSSLKITARQQLKFIQSLYHETLPFPSEIQQSVKEIMVYRTGENYILRGKTGSDWDERYILGWYVGWLETGDKAYAFAAAVQDGELASGRNTRDMLIRYFEACGIMNSVEDN